MRFLFAVLLLVCAAFTTAMGRCGPEYAKLPGHTMCLTDSPGVEKSGVSKKEKAAIVALHNKLRSKTSPSATDLTVMVWRDELAKVAEKWAKQCRQGHDKGIHRTVPGLGLSVGQNMAYGQESWEEAIKAWHSEVKDFRYGSGAIGGAVIGHYTQLVMKNTHLVGCGYAYCKNSRYRHHYACNYASGQLTDDMATPYTRGKRCSACPNTCVNGLCDCKGKICENEGKLDLNTCTCTCMEGYSGGNCSVVECPNSEPDMCRNTPNICAMYSNAKTLCPITCGPCEAPCNGMICENDGTLDVNTCTCDCSKYKYFSGDRCEKVRCPNRDDSYCNGSYCRYSNGKQLCPRTCGLC